MSLDKPSSRWERKCPPNTTAKQRKYVHGRDPKRVEHTRVKLCCQRERFCGLVAGGPTLSVAVELGFRIEISVLSG